MATAAAVGEIWQVTVRGKLEGQDCMNVLSFKCVHATASVETELLLVLLACYIEHLVPILVGAFSIESLRAKQVSPILGPEIEVTPTETMAAAGAGSGDGLPSYVSAHISIHTTRGGRSGRGRMYIGGIVEGDTILSNISAESSTWEGILAFVACLATKFIGTGFDVAQRFELGVMSRKIGGAKPPFLDTGFAGCTSLVPHRDLGTTRSRKVGHGS
jgi:hypothetical protein